MYSKSAVYLTKTEKLKRLRTLLDEVAYLEEDMYGERRSNRFRNLEKNNQRWNWIEQNASVLWTEEGEGICSFVVHMEPQFHLNKTEAVRLLVDRGITESLQPLDLVSSLETRCPNQIVLKSGDLSCKYCKGSP